MTDGIRASAIGTGRSAGDEFPFTASQWQELEHQTLAFKYIVSGVPVPPDLISTLITTPSSSLLFPHQHQLPIGWGCFQVGYGRKIDPEPGRCRRTDGKKWRCSKEACPNSKYCEKHVNRGKSKSKKQQQQTHQPLIKPNTSSTTSSATLAIPAISSSYPAGPHDYSQRSLPSMTPSGHEATSVYPRLSARSSLTGQTQPAPQWLMDPEFYDHQANKTIRFEF